MVECEKIGSIAKQLRAIFSHSTTGAENQNEKSLITQYYVNIALPLWREKINFTKIFSRRLAVRKGLLSLYFFLKSKPLYEPKASEKRSPFYECYWNEGRLDFTLSDLEPDCK